MYGCVGSRGESLRNWKPSKATVSSPGAWGGRPTATTRAAGTSCRRRRRHESLYSPCKCTAVRDAVPTRGASCNTDTPRYTQAPMAAACEPCASVAPRRYLSLSLRRVHYIINRPPRGRASGAGVGRRSLSWSLDVRSTRRSSEEVVAPRAPGTDLCCAGARGARPLVRWHAASRRGCILGMAAIDRLRQVVRHVAAVAVAPEGSSENQVLAGVDDGEIVRAGEAQALAAPNRGPLLVHGKLNPAIAPLFEEWGFFVLEGVIGDEELEDLRADIGGLIDRAPVSKGSELDKFGRPAEKAQWNIQPPLSDPNGGRGRSPAKGMRTPTPAADAPKEVPMSLQSYLPHSEAGLRLYAHPGLLALAAAVNGNTFCPFSESIQIKLPGLGPSVTWHQDGTTHWEQPEPEHGFNFMCQVRITVLCTALSRRAPCRGITVMRHRTLPGSFTAPPQRMGCGLYRSPTASAGSISRSWSNNTATESPARCRWCANQATL